MCCLKCTLQSILDGSPDYSGIEYYLDSLGEGAAVHRLSRTIICTDCWEKQWPVKRQERLQFSMTGCLPVK